MMLNLRRNEAPISARAWEEIDAEARRVLELDLAARKLVDFVGPLGWKTSGVSVGRADSAEELIPGVSTELRKIQPLVELRLDFALSRRALEDVDRGAEDVELDPVVVAAQKLAAAEDTLVFSGYGPGAVRGLGGGSAHAPLTISTHYEKYPMTVSEATSTLRRAGVDGPYGIALGPRCYAGLMQAPSAGGYPVLERLRNVLLGPIVRAPAVNGAIVLSMRGGDFGLHVGQDLSVGYHAHDDDQLHLFLTESLTFRNLAPEAAIALVYA